MPRLCEIPDMTATEARRLASDERRCRNTFDRVLEEIRARANRGYMLLNTNIPVGHSEYVVRELYTRGFSVDDYGDGCLIVKWS